MHLAALHGSSGGIGGEGAVEPAAAMRTTWAQPSARSSAAAATQLRSSSNSKRRVHNALAPRTTQMNKTPMRSSPLSLTLLHTQAESFDGAALLQVIRDRCAAISRCGSSGVCMSAK